MAAMRRRLLASSCIVWALHVVFNVSGFLLMPRFASFRLGAGIARRAAVPDLGVLDDVMKDPEKAKELQEKANEMMKDPEKRRAIEDWQRSVATTVEKLQNDPELADMFKDLKENGLSAFDKYREDKRVMEKIGQAQAELNEEIIQDQAERDLEDELINEIFGKFDVDKDGILNLEEFNALQAATEGPAAVYQQEQLEALLLAVNPENKEPSRGMPFEDYRRLYVDSTLKQAYNTDVVRDHGKIFGSSEVPGSIPDTEVPGGLFAD